ncbi:MAG: alpha/beta hydrolase [bacterium]|nr:alpha/beta hydrolase [Planctomycetota bacterium]HIL52764.1 alpha/beta hydrolase [Planctomycetota bacterium]
MSCTDLDLGEIRNSVGERLDYSLVSGNAECRDVVVIGHGVTGNKDREWALTLAECLRVAGFCALRFSFAGNGASEGVFENSCPTKETADLAAVLDRLGGWRVTFVGHSMGAAVGVLRASADERIERLVSLAGMVHTADFAQRKFGDLEAGHDSMWEKPDCPLSQVFLDDMRGIGSVEALAEEVRVPWLLVHGRADEVVPFEESEAILARAGGRAELFALDGADHVFSGGAARTMALRVVAWLEEQGAED